MNLPAQSEALYQDIAQRVGSSPYPKNFSKHIADTVAALRAGKILHYAQGQKPCVGKFNIPPDLKIIQAVGSISRDVSLGAVGAEAGILGVTLATHGAVFGGITASLASGGAVSAGSAGGTAVASSLSALTTASIFLAPVGIILGVLGAIFAHHAAAVAKEQATLCAVVPSVNVAIDTLDQMVRDGKITPAQGYDALQKIFGLYQKSIGQIVHTDNEAYGLGRELWANIELRRTVYAQIAPTTAQSIASKLSALSPAAKGLTLAAMVGVGALIVTR